MDLPTQQKYPMCHLSRQPPLDKQKPGNSQRAHHSDLKPSGSTRHFSELPEVPPDTFTVSEAGSN